MGYKFSDENIENIIHICDDNGDGELNFQEFLALNDFLDYLKVCVDDMSVAHAVILP